MYAAAPLIDARLRRSISRRACEPGPIAEIWRRICAEATRLHLYRPSYEQVRVLVHLARMLARVARTAILLVSLRPPTRAADAHAPGATNRRRFRGRGRRVLQRLRL